MRTGGLRERSITHCGHLVGRGEAVGGGEGGEGREGITWGEMPDIVCT